MGEWMRTEPEEKAAFTKLDATDLLYLRFRNAQISGKLEISQGRGHTKTRIEIYGSPEDVIAQARALGEGKRPE